MQIIRISPRGFGANTYALTADNENAVVIDAAQPRIEAELIKLGLTPRFVLLTHCHFDHVAGVSALQQSGATVICLDKEKPLVGTHADLFDYFGAPRTAYKIDKTVRDGEELELCGIRIKVLAASGHTAGGACYMAVDKEGKKYLFSGDTLFAGSIGRTDFPTGDLRALRESLKRLSALEDMPVYAGHGDETTIFAERQTNPFLTDL